MSFRNQAVKILGLKTDSPDFIQIKTLDPMTIQFSGFDRHLDFACLLQVNDFKLHQEVSLKTIVRIHNRLGKLYFGVVQHIHPYVVCALLNSLQVNRFDK